MDTSATRWVAAELRLDQAADSANILAIGLAADLDLAEPSAGRIDVAKVVAGLRHIDASAEPAFVFTQLAAVCVPDLCDAVVMDLVENDHVYRISRPAGDPQLPRPIVGPSSPCPALDDSPVLGSHTVWAAIRSAEFDSIGSLLSGTLLCSWRDGYVPVAADASLVGLMIDHALALIHRELLTGRVGDIGEHAAELQGRLARDRRVASAVGVVMALHHVDQSAAMALLVRISGRTGRGLDDIAESVVDSGTLPPVPESTAGSAPRNRPPGRLTDDPARGHRRIGHP